MTVTLPDAIVFTAILALVPWPWGFYVVGAIVALAFLEWITR